MKKRRQGKIKEIIRQFDVGTQEELAERLKDAGFSVTQATVSRDIREMKLSKMPTEDGGQKYIFWEQGGSPVENKYVRVLQEAYASAETAQNIVVVKTESGRRPGRTGPAGGGWLYRRGRYHFCGSA